MHERAVTPDVTQVSIDRVILRVLANACDGSDEYGLWMWVMRELDKPLYERMWGNARRGAIPRAKHFDRHAMRWLRQLRARLAYLLSRAEITAEPGERRPTYHLPPKTA